MGKLLGKAKSIKVTRQTKQFSSEDIELVEAWLSDEISLTQIVKVKGFQQTTSAYIYIAHVLRYSYQWNNK